MSSLARLRVTAVLAAVVTTMATGHGYQSPQTSLPWPPGVQRVPADSPALSPAEALKTFSMPPGYHLELVASEPLIQDPIAIDWDGDGRLWAVEMPGFVPDLAAPEPNMDPIGRVVVLEDTDNDGVMDKRTVFADGLVLARSHEGPRSWSARRRAAERLADARHERRSAHGHEGPRDRRIRPARGPSRAERQRSPLGARQLDRYRRTPTSSCGSRTASSRRRRRWCAASGASPTMTRAGSTGIRTNRRCTSTSCRRRTISAIRICCARAAATKRFATTMTPSTWSGRHDRTPEPIARIRRASIARTERWRGSRRSVRRWCIAAIDCLQDVYGNAFVAEPAANLVSRIILSDDGTTLRARKAYEQAEFLTSTDERFRPVYLSNAPDGTLYIVDMYRGVIQQRADITEYLRDHIITHKLERPTGLGRIYRVVHETTKRDTEKGPATRTSEQLVARLSHPNGWWRDSAQQWLVERSDKSVVPALVKLAADAKDWRTRVHALWTLDGLDSIDPPTVTKALDDPSRDVRVTAIRIAERWLGDADQSDPGGGAAARGRCGLGRAAAARGDARRFAGGVAGTRRRVHARSSCGRSDRGRRGVEWRSWHRGCGPRRADRERRCSDAPARCRDDDGCVDDCPRCPGRGRPELCSLRLPLTTARSGCERHSCAARRSRCSERSRPGLAPGVAAARPTRRICRARRVRADAPGLAARTRLLSALKIHPLQGEAAVGRGAYGSTASRRRWSKWAPRGANWRLVSPVSWLESTGQGSRAPQRLSRR